MTIYKLIFLFIFAFCFLSCASGKSAKKMPPLSEYKVSVESGGKKIENPSPDLLKRIRIRSSDIISVFGSGNAPKVPALSVVRAYDSRSQIMGLEIAHRSSVSDALGLQAGDVLTAVGHKHLKNSDDLKYFGKLFHATNELSFTYERKGIARKTILYRVEG